MRVPSFELMRFGLFDSRIAIPGKTHTDYRTVNRYEFDIFPTNQIGLCYLDTACFTPCQGMIICAKPGQQRRSILPIQCHYIHIRSEDPEAIRMLNNLPDLVCTDDLTPLMDIFQDPDVVSDRHNPNRVLLRQSYAYKFLHTIFRLSSEASDNSKAIAAKLSPNAHQATLMRVNEYIRTHLSEPLSLEFLATIANLSPNYFHRLFTKQFGQTPNHHIIELRIRAARAKLAYTDQPLAQIAMDCGFSSQSYFTSRFTKETGKTPLQYRKEMQSRMLP